MSEENAVMDMLVPEVSGEDAGTEVANDPGSDDLRLDDAIGGGDRQETLQTSKSPTDNEDVSADASKKAEPEKSSQDKTEDKSKELHRVPVYELQQERSKRQVAERNSETLQTSISTLEAEIQALKNPATPAPDEDEDPEGFLKHKTKELEDKITDIKTKGDEAEAKTAQNQQREKVQNHINTKQTEFEATTPDFKESMLHMRSAQYNSLMEKGFTDEQAINGIFQHEFDQATKLMAMGLNPAQIMYQQSVDKFGYVKPAPKADPVPAVDDNAATKEKFANTDKALAAASGSGKSGGNLSVEQLLRSPDEEFNKAWSEANGGVKNPYS